MADRTTALFRSFERQSDDLNDLLRRKRSGRSRSGLLRENGFKGRGQLSGILPLDRLQKWSRFLPTGSPPSDRVGRNVEFSSDLNVASIFIGPEEDPSATRQRLRARLATGQELQMTALKRR
jgi:hypothetical protein